MQGLDDRRVEDADDKAPPERGPCGAIHEQLEYGGLNSYLHYSGGPCVYSMIYPQNPILIIEAGPYITLSLLIF